MKVLGIISAIALAAGIASANHHHGVEIAPTIVMQSKVHKAGSYAVPVTSACKAGDQVRTAKEFGVCESWLSDRGGMTCTKWTKEVLSTDISGTKTVYNGGQGGSSQIVEFNHDVTYTIQMVVADRGGNTVVGTKSFTLPNCQ